MLSTHNAPTRSTCTNAAPGSCSRPSRTSRAERGTWQVADAVNEQPWLPNGPIPTQVTESRSAGHAEQAQARDEQDHGHDMGTGIPT
jgi:hypothetical protein